MMPNQNGMPTMSQMAGQQKQQGMGMGQGQGQQGAMANAATIVTKITKVLEDSGYFELPENKDRRGEINKELYAIAQAIVEGNDQVLMNSEIYKYITGLNGTQGRPQDARAKMAIPQQGPAPGGM